MLHRWAAILVLVALLAHPVCGGLCRAHNVIYLCHDGHAPSAAATHAHPAHADPHHSPADLLDPAHEHAPGEPAHVHVCRDDPTAPRPRDTGAVSKLVPLAVALLTHSEASWRPVCHRGRASCAWWAIGPPPSLRTTRLRI